MTPIIVPGLQGSCGAHWQTWLQCRLPGSRRVEQPDWDSPDLDRWSTVLRRDVQLVCGNALIIAHSFGCLAAIDALGSGCARVAAALLVAPADPAHFGIPDARLAERLPVPTIVVGGHNDPWMSFDLATAWSQRLGCWLFDAGHVGHINVASGHGPWPDALDLVAALARPTLLARHDFTTGFERTAADIPRLGISKSEIRGWSAANAALPASLWHQSRISRASDR